MQSRNFIPNHDFSVGEIGELPQGWSAFSPQPYLSPAFRLGNKNGRKVLIAEGNGNANCVGRLTANVNLTGCRTYRLWVRFQVSEGVDPYQNLVFSWMDRRVHEGILHFRTLANHEIEGENRFVVPGDGKVSGEVRVTFRLSKAGQAWISGIGIEECEPIPERNVRVACVQGRGNMESWSNVLDLAAGRHADMILLPETFISGDPQKAESIDGPCATLMSQKAREHGMYVSGTFIHRDEADGHLYNTGLLFGRAGERIGRYDKIHPYTPELMEDGITPGTDVPVFKTDFGTVGMMICYDSWFTDVAELLALKGAEIILFPNAGYYRTILPARAADNGVRLVCSSLNSPPGVWDTSGADVEDPDHDPTRYARDDITFTDVTRESIEGIHMLLVTLDLNQSPSPHHNGGPMNSAPGGRRNRREQKNLLLDEIKNEIGHWKNETGRLV